MDKKELDSAIAMRAAARKAQEKGLRLIEEGKRMIQDGQKMLIDAATDIEGAQRLMIGVDNRIKERDEKFAERAHRQPKGKFMEFFMEVAKRYGERVQEEEARGGTWGEDSWGGPAATGFEI